ncbi:hypothetical protein CC85DRAFT_151940 [Cutaneotrichosporon oleaginosum]|uniref:GATA-type domain-containing protein n=1 Tax=Cutaneotrichosporon oleaginosum TaxID=879819 RepID=A0A0J0XVU4_9TREE|nr:uncharacterized protein CC85DRAFT_151940 [Cutaneotrichosporon oleaginosum]KLT45186.1 hypothetical protein CC85DRAFT_151940 [Cutaneotrichosporon oleaginosum]TXT14978.1 hypothetical protein COLE_01171 [Cutaneotrichosporon oleaginosum]
MAAIRIRREELTKKQDTKQRNGIGATGGPIRPPPPRLPSNMASSAPHPYPHSRPRETIRCSGCNTTQSLEWLTGPDGPHSLCHSCGVSVVEPPHLSPTGALLTISTSTKFLMRARAIPTSHPYQVSTLRRPHPRASQLPLTSVPGHTGHSSNLIGLGPT